jgi:Kef-type K+ transport system membrane component KefB
MTSLSRTVLLLAALYVAGAAWAVADDLAPLGDAIVNGTPINAPLVIVAAQSLGAAIALRAQGRARRAGAALVLLACTVSLAAAAFDGDLGEGGLSALQVAYQAAITLVTAITWVLAATSLRPVAVRAAPGSIDGA